MSKQFVQNKYNPGDVVYTKVNPKLGLVIRQYIDRLYYCKVQDDLERKELDYFEGELAQNHELIEKNQRLLE